MRRTRLGSVLLAVASLVASFALAGGTAQDATSKLFPPDGSPQPKAIGVCGVLDGGDAQRIKLVVEGASETVPLVILMGDGQENLATVGELPKGSSRREWMRTTLEGGELPYGAASVRELGGRRIEIRDPEENVVLKGEVPELPAVKEDQGGGDGGKDDEGDGGKDDEGDGGKDDPGTDGGDVPAEPRTAKAVFRRTEFAGDREARGVVVVTKRSDGGGVRFEFGRLAPETGYLLSVGARGTMSLVADFRTNGDGGAELARDTAKDPGLPLGAKGVDALAGKRVEVRDLDENVVLYTEIPSVETAKDVEPVKETKRTEDETTGADATVKVVIRPEKGREEMTVVVKDVPREEKGGTKEAAKRAERRFAELRIDDGSGAAQTVGRARVRGRRARIHFTTRGGRELPLGVESLRDLSGRPFEVNVGGVRVVSGALPQF